MTTVSPGTRLVGREFEIRQLRALVDGTRDQGAAVVVRGQAGIGKSALLMEARRAASARGMRVLSTIGVESEAQLPFAGLHRILRPVLGLSDRLPVPQRRALLAAFGMADDPAPDLFMIALAALGLVVEAAADTPTLIAVDDSHWIDRPSADVMAFIARRLESDSVVLIAALRDGFPSAFDDPNLDVLPLDGLDDDAAAELMDRYAPGLLPPVRERLLQEAAGNPLALVELPFSAQDRTVARPPVWLPLTTRLEHAFADRVSGLPTATRTLLLVAALNDGDELPSTLAAAAAVARGDVTLEDLTPAVAARLIESDGATMSFRHPLMRTAIRQRSSPAQRHAAHAALAQALAAEPDRSVWHRAAACPGPNDDVAAELETVAIRAQRRGAVSAGVAALERAADLSLQPAQRSARLLQAAELAVELGRHDIVVRLLQEAAVIDLPAQQRTRMTWIRDTFDEGLRNADEGTRALVELADKVSAQGDTDLALKFLSGAALRCWWAGRSPSGRDSVVAVAERLAVDQHDARLVMVLAFAAPLTTGSVVLERLHHVARSNTRNARENRLLGIAATAVGAFDLAAEFLASSLDDLRAEGRLGLLARARTLQAWSAANLADLNLAATAAEEGARLASETSQPVIFATARVTQALIAALRGEEIEDFAVEAEQVALPVDANGLLAAVQLARGAAALARGHHTAAWEQLRPLHDPDNPAHHETIRTFSLGDLAEAAAHSGHRAEARLVIAQMEELALRTPSPVLHVGLRHARALLADDADAGRLFVAASTADLTHWPFARARAQLAHGAWLRRQRQAGESRAPLRAARETFDALGTTPWGERARQELRASGERSRRRTPETRDQLTPQEMQIAQLAADGFTNREIGDQLYLSHRTVSSHLHRIFPKLGITSRAKLGVALSS
jgi:DNA-binding CsgD family transcriptional regulator